MNANATSEETFSTAKVRVANKYIYLFTKWKDCVDDIFHIIVFDGKSHWSGRLSRDFAKKFYANADQEEEEYYSDVKKSLLGTGTFVYEFTVNTDGTAKFSWKRSYEDTDVYLLHGWISLTKEDKEEENSIIDHLLLENTELKRKLHSSVHSSSELSANLDRFKSELNKVIDMKENEEKHLYGKFVQLLNCKKRRISLLDQTLKKYTDNTES